MTEPNSAGHIAIQASPARVYELITDLDMLSKLAEEFSGYRLLDHATGPVCVGTRFRGTSRNGWHRWSTTCTVTDADPHRRFAFEVTSGPFQVSRWQYDIELDGEGVLVTESAWDRRAHWAKIVGGIAVGVLDRDAANRDHIATTLQRLKQCAES